MVAVAVVGHLTIIDIESGGGGSGIGGVGIRGRRGSSGAGAGGARVGCVVGA